ncbi:P-loop containing nucleoside triphosphate hydrolase protein, partial [Nadsonia fulvescens var. elongata DSM 6958]
YTTQMSSVKSLNLSEPVEWFPTARALPRKVIMHVGPTNSGKTYNALQRLMTAKTGCYAGPLRLLAREVYERHQSQGIRCNLVTGEEVIEDIDQNGNSASITACTVEMVSTTKPLDVVVIDEIQLISDEKRGWAWTNAYLGVQANEIHLCGEASAVPLIKKLSEMVGDEFEVREYQRLNPLVVQKNSLKGELEKIQAGDCIVAFSRKELFDLKAMIEERNGLKCAIIYGSLPPESRAKQAQDFNNPDNDIKVLVASDAIGMGLNLSIKRVIFSKADKFDGFGQVPLAFPFVKQIGGRAGRYKTSTMGQSNNNPDAFLDADNQVLPQTDSPGSVTTLWSDDLEYVREAMASPIVNIKRAGLYPMDEHIITFSNEFPEGTSTRQILIAMGQAAKLSETFFLCNFESLLNIATVLDMIPTLTLSDKLKLLKAPVKEKISLCFQMFAKLASIVANGQIVNLTEIKGIDLSLLKLSGQRLGMDELNRLEVLHSNISLFLWTSYRFPVNLIDRIGAMELKVLCEQKIDEALAQTRNEREQMSKLRQEK